MEISVVNVYICDVRFILNLRLLKALSPRLSSFSFNVNKFEDLFDYAGKGQEVAIDTGVLRTWANKIMSTDN